MMSAFCRDSAATRRFAPRGMTTFTFAELTSRHAATSESAAMITKPRRARLRSSGISVFEWVDGGEHLHAHRLLEQHRGSERVDVSLALARLAPHLAHGAQGDGRRESLIHQRHRQCRAARKLVRDTSALDGARRIVAVAVE